MAVARLADELLQMILAPTLAISREQFISSSPTTFGKNDAVSSASVLLVCKRWLRVGTPILYETVIIRSSGQSRALADAFNNNRSFAKHVKRLRLESAYQFLDAVLPPCTNLVTLVLLLHIYSDTTVTGLCRSLPLISPSAVVLCDKWTKANANVRKVFLALCDAIPKWTKMTSFEYPYGGYDGYGRIGLLTRRDLLVDALAQSKSLRTFYSPLSQLEAEQWRRLARASSVTFKFYYVPHRGLDLERLEMLADGIKSSERLTSASVGFVELKPTAAFREQNFAAVDDCIPPFKDFSIEDVNDDVWGTIFGFAAMPGYPDSPEIFCPSFLTRELEDFNLTRKAISLTCRKFERLIRPLFFTFPVLVNFSSLQGFKERILQTPTLGRRVRVLAFDASLHTNPEPDIEGLLGALLPHLTNLLHFDFGWYRYHKLPMSLGLLRLLAETTGDTLLTLTGFTFSHLVEGPSLSSFVPFKPLRRLDIPPDGAHSEPLPTLDVGFLVKVRTLRIDGFGGLFASLCTIRLPALTSVSFFYPPGGTVEKLLLTSGSKVEDLTVIGSANFTNVFTLTPNLLRLEWTPKDGAISQFSILRRALGKCAEHKKLECLILNVLLGLGVGEKVHNCVVDILFRCLHLENFPSLKEIRFPDYQWPVDERSISKQLLPAKAVQVKEEYGIEIKDGSGKPWRPRAPKRR